MDIRKGMDKGLRVMGALFVLALIVGVVGATRLSDNTSTFTGDVVFEFPSVTHRVNSSGFFDNNTLLGAGALSTATQPLNSKGNSFASVQGALDDLAGDGWVYVPSGVFTENVTISDDNVVLFGAGWSSVIDGSTTGSAVNITGDRNTVRDLQLKTLPGGGNPFSNIVVSGANNHIDNVFGNGSDSFGFNINPGTAVVNWVTDSYIFDADTVGLLSQGSTIMTENKIEQSGTHGIQLGSLGDRSVGANNIINVSGDDGINIGSSAENNVFTGNFIAGSTNEDIDDDSGTSVVLGNLAGNSTIKTDLLPHQTNAVSIGSKSLKFKVGHFVSTDVGDVIFGNDFKVVESMASDEVDGEPRLYFINDFNETIMSLSRGGDIHLAGDLHTFHNFRPGIYGNYNLQHNKTRMADMGLVE